MRKLTIVLSILPLLAACSAATTGADPLAGSAWNLTTLQGEATLPGSSITLSFDEGGQAGGSAGCNSYGGSYAVSGEALSFGALVSTQMACLAPAGVMDQEQAYLQALGQAAGYNLDADSLEILDDAGNVVLVFAPQTVAPDASLDGTDWQLTTFVEGEAASSLLAGSTITARFEDGRVGGSGGCNTYGAAYQAEGGTLSIDVAEATEMACLEPEGVMDQETRYLDALSAVDSYVIEGSQLTLSAPDGRQLIYTAQPAAGA